MRPLNLQDKPLQKTLLSYVLLCLCRFHSILEKHLTKHFLKLLRAIVKLKKCQMFQKILYGHYNYGFLTGIKSLFSFRQYKYAGTMHMHRAGNRTQVIDLTRRSSSSLTKSANRLYPIAVNIYFV